MPFFLTITDQVLVKGMKMVTLSDFSYKKTAVRSAVIGVSAAYLSEPGHEGALPLIDQPDPQIIAPPANSQV